MADELLDYVDENDNVLGQVWRSEIDDKGLLGRIVGVIVFNSKGEVLICKEAAHKPSGGMWKFSAAGHVSAGETPEEAAVKEAKEEAGIDIKVDDLEKLVSFKHVRKDGAAGRIIHIFKVIYDGDITLDKSEFSEFRFVKPDEIDAEMSTNPETFGESFTTFWKKWKR